MRTKLKIGSIVRTASNLIPAREAGLLAVVIPYDEFAAGKPSTQARFHWPLPDLQTAIFIRFLEGKVKDHVTMITRWGIRKVSGKGRP